jgi:DNA-binding response OmpR family regulator
MASDTHKRVLVVDDDDDVRHLIASVLRQHALLVDEASDGRQALTLLGENSYAVVLLDLLMPVASGFDVLAQMDVAGSSVPPVVLVVTGADRSVVDGLDSRRIHGIVKKPFDAEELASLVAACAEIRGRGFGAMAIATLVASSWFFAGT